MSVGVAGTDKLPVRRHARRARPDTYVMGAATVPTIRRRQMSQAEYYPADDGLTAVEAVVNYVRDTGVKPVTHIATEVRGHNRRAHTPNDRKGGIRVARPTSP